MPDHYDADELSAEELDAVSGGNLNECTNNAAGCGAGSTNSCTNTVDGCGSKVTEPT